MVYFSPIIMFLGNWPFEHWHWLFAARPIRKPRCRRRRKSELREPCFDRRNVVKDRSKPTEQDQSLRNRSRIALNSHHTCELDPGRRWPSRETGITEGFHDHESGSVEDCQNRAEHDFTGVPTRGRRFEYSARAARVSARQLPATG